MVQTTGSIALITERVLAGLAAAKKRGRVGGRPAAIPPEKLELIIAALDVWMSGCRKQLFVVNLPSSAQR